MPSSPDGSRPRQPARPTRSIRCDREAPDALRREPDFRRLFDGMADSLRQMPDAVDARDTARNCIGC